MFIIVIHYFKTYLNYLSTSFGAHTVPLLTTCAFATFKNADSIYSLTAVKPRPPPPCKLQQNVSIIIRSVIHYDYFIETITMVIFLSFQANAVYDTELAESIQKGRQHIQPSANGYLVAPGIAPGKFY